MTVNLIDAANRASEELSAIRKIRESLDGDLHDIDEQIAKLFSFARHNQGQVAHPPTVSQPASHLFERKAILQSALALAKHTESEKKRQFQDLEDQVRRSAT